MPLSSCPAEELGIALLRSAAKIEEPGQRARAARFFRAALILLEERNFSQALSATPETHAFALREIADNLGMAAEHMSWLAAQALTVIG